MNNREKYDEAIRNSFELEEQFDVKTAKRGETGNWDSLGHMVLIDNIESAFDIMMEPEDILEFKSYEIGIEILKKYDVEM